MWNLSQHLPVACKRGIGYYTVWRKKEHIMSAMQDAIQKILQAIPADVHYLQEDLSAHTRQVLEDMLRRMDLVSYQEFRAQKQVLAKTRAKLEALEKQVAALEQATPSS
jgi:BMFP domain-containing protein YqiC